MVLSDMPVDELETIWKALEELGMANPTVGTLADMICCPGGHFCSLANAKSIPIAQALQARFEDLDFLYDPGPLDLNISGCMNARGHHHVGNIGILG
ncbi:nitrite/sulfite reductase, partial [Cobetia sp. SIMBA_158]